MKYSYLFLFLLLISCGNPDKNQETTDSSKTLEAGNWRLSFNVEDSGFKELPIQTIVDNDGTLTIYNSEEQIELTDIEIKGDSVYIRPPIFEGYFAGKFTQEGLIRGSYIKPSLDRVVDFFLEKGASNRFSEEESDDFEMAQLPQIWEVVFSPDNPEEKYIAKGVFTQSGNKVTGTFETTTGDYRYLEGTYKNDKLYLSTFDGAHLFLFEADLKDGVMSGTFYSGNHWVEPFIGKANATYELPDANELTFLKDGYDSFDFSFPDENGNVISLSDDRFKNKVVVAQIMGSWCPNCLDETKFYLEYLKNEQPDDVEFIGIAFEYAPTKEKAYESIQRFKKKLNVPYPIVLAQYGSVEKDEANEKLPMLNHVISYPTSIYIDKSGKVRRIHTGYNGPATGAKFDRFKEEFYSFLKELREEEVST